MASERNEATGALTEFEKKFGLPSLSKFFNDLGKLPSMPRLRLIKSILETCDRLSHNVPNLDQVIRLVAVISDTSTEKLEMLEKVLKQANKLLAKAPNELLEFLSSLKDE